jgi:hypothetical protein
MKITTSQLRQIIREEIQKQRIQEGVLDKLYTKFHNAVKGAKEWAGKKGIQFKVRRPTAQEYYIADRTLTKVDAIGVDTITGNIYAYDGDQKYEYIISADGKVLSKIEGYGI